MTAIAAWYRGQVISITALRPQSVIKDDVVPVLLREVRQPTFVTINVADLWRKVRPHAGYCIINADVPFHRIRDVPDLLRRVLRLPEFATRAARMSKVLRVTPHLVEYYGLDGQVQSLPWAVS